MGKIRYERRPSCQVRIGLEPLKIGASNPIVLQSMTSTPTLDVDASFEQALSIINAGGQMVRLTAQTASHAQAIGVLRDKLREKGILTPVVADIHFNRNAAMAAAECVDKVRINPGNFADPGRTFQKVEFTDQEYAQELENIRNLFLPLLDILRKNNGALRIGVNYGSLSDRIMSRYGNTPAGVVESAMEYLRICRDEHFQDVVVSIKSSNTVVMAQTVRRMAKAMADEGMSYPLHLGVTEAGDGDDGRIKSALGIGSLLAEGLGDTIRVSLSEEPANEIPVARAIADYIQKTKSTEYPDNFPQGYDPLAPERLGRFKDQPVVVGLDLTAEEAYRDHQVIEGKNASEAMFRFNEASPEKKRIIRLHYQGEDYQKIAVEAAIDFGRVLLSGMQDGIWIDAPGLSPEQIVRLSLDILQASRLRISKTEYIACPGCGRTLFDLRDVLHKVKDATCHLKGLKIGVMGCIVNGPGEMADADYGYVGGAPGKVSLYKSKECIVRNLIPEEAIPRLIQLIKDNGDWVDPE